MNKLFELCLKWLMVRKFRELRAENRLLDAINEWHLFRAQAMHDLGFFDEVKVR